jgi:hypothetical protein
MNGGWLPVKDVIKFFADAVNNLHDLLIVIVQLFGLEVTDKQLHFWVIGVFGMVSFTFVQIFFKWMAKYSITAISFVYTFTILIVIVFAIEIQQKVTNRGNMEFQDAVIGLWGFCVLFFVYLAIRITYWLMTKAFVKNKKNKRRNRQSIDFE